MEHKFKVGDKVKVHYLTGNRIGYIQERKSELRYDIRYDEGCIGHDIEENRIVKYNGNQDMEIKVGDKVRVSKDAPKLLFTRSICNYPEYVFEVRVIEDDLADIYYGAGKIPLAAFVIPTKYLIKVEDEAKEPKFKVGDKVKDISSPHDSGIYKVDDIKKSSDGFLYHIQGLIGKSNVKESDLEPYTEPTVPTIKVGDRVRNVSSGLIGTVDNIAYGNVAWVNGVDGKRYHWKSNELELVQPKEPTEDEIIRQREAEFDEFRKAELDRVLHPEKYHTYEVTIDNVAMDWQSYEADLAKEIALKVANKYNDPKEAADYAVSVAKAIVEGLKKK